MCYYLRHSYEYVLVYFKLACLKNKPGKIRCDKMEKYIINIKFNRIKTFLNFIFTFVKWTDFSTECFVKPRCVRKIKLLCTISEVLVNIEWVILKHFCQHQCLIRCHWCVIIIYKCYLKKTRHYIVLLINKYNYYSNYHYISL